MVNFATDDVLYIALTFDIDSDYFDSSLTSAGSDFRNLLSWKGIEEGVPLVSEVVGAYSDDYDNKARITWFVRADQQLGDIYGDPSYLLEKHELLWRRCLDTGDEIGWHPDLYRLEDGKWQQETDDRRLVDALVNSYNAMRKKRFLPISSRIGEAFCSNAVIATLDRLGFRCDSTAMPGRVRRDQDRCLDWEGTPEGPYHPSCSDYRRPGQLHLKLLEVPKSMVQTEAEYDERPLRRYVDLSFRHKALREGLRAYLSNARLLVTLSHPYTVLSGVTNRRHGLLSFDIHEFKRNLDFVLEECRRLGRKYRFITVGDCWNLFAHTGCVVG